MLILNSDQTLLLHVTFPRSTESLKSLAVPIDHYLSGKNFLKNNKVLLPFLSNVLLTNLKDADRNFFSNELRIFSVKNANARIPKLCDLLQAHGITPIFPKYCLIDREQGDIDVLVPIEKYHYVVSLLLSMSYYREKSQFYEPWKSRLHNKSGEVMHVHGKLHWELEYLDTIEIRQHALPNSRDILIPSTEDAIIITVAHAFFEGHKILLADLLQIKELMSNKSVDWLYIGEKVKRNGWACPFFTFITGVNTLSQLVYGYSIVPNSTVGVLSKNCGKLEKFMMYISTKGKTVPLEYIRASVFVCFVKVAFKRHGIKGIFFAFDVLMDRLKCYLRDK